MDPLEIYKRLPKTNCGECPQKTCMAFAIYIKTNPEELDKCKHVDSSKLAEIRGLLNKGDWRDELIASIKKEIQEIDISKAGPELGAVTSNNGMVIRCIGRDYLIDQDGNISPEPYNKWLSILLLHYIRTLGKGELSGQWVSFSEFKGGLVKASTFQRDCEEPLREMFDELGNRVELYLERIGGKRVSGFPADSAWVMDILPKVRVLLLYSKGDDEFPSSLNIVFDKITGEFLDVESIIFLLEGFVHTLRMMSRMI